MQVFWIWDWSIFRNRIELGNVDKKQPENRLKKYQMTEREEFNMIKTYILEDLDCAHCAGKIEEASLTAEVKKIVKKYEPDVEVIEK